MAQQPENFSFEEWEMVGFENQFPEPVNWSSLKTSEPENLANVSPEVMFKSTDAHSGSFSVHLISKSVFGIVANGIITNGRIHADFDPAAGFTYTDPDDATGVWRILHTFISFLVCASTPLAASITMITLSAAVRVLKVSSAKSWCPGVSRMLIFFLP